MKQHFEIYRSNGATIAGYVENETMVLLRKDHQSLPKSLVKKVIGSINDDIGFGFMHQDDWVVHILGDTK